MFGFIQLYVRRDEKGSISHLLALMTDEVLVSVSELSMMTFAGEISRRIRISKSIIEDEMKFNECTMSQSEQGSVQLSM